jgi:RNA methyltransferase, TrmH family
MLSKTQAKYIQSLFHKKFRDEHGRFIVEGPKMVSEAILHAPQDIEQIYVLSSWITEMDVSNIPITEVPAFEMEKISSLSTASPALAILRKPVLQRPAPVNGITLVLDTIQDPGNLGTIIRTAEWFGVQQIICSEGTADCYNPKVIQATMGSIFRMPVFYEDIMEWVGQLKDIPVLAASLDGKPMKPGRPGKDLVVIVGNESAGIRPALQAMATQRWLIPRHGEAESLNAAVATGIMLYALTT